MNQPARPQQGPSPGDIFRSYRYASEIIIELDPTANKDHPKLNKRRKVSHRGRSLDIWDLEDATKAEIALEYWGGHIGTSDHKLRVNGGEWLPIPQIDGTPSSPLCYMRNIMGRAIVSIPLELLRVGHNSFEFSCGPQAFHGMTWGIFKIYAFTVRVYYNDTKSHADGRMVSPLGGQEIEDFPEIEAEATAAPANDTKMEFTGSDPVRIDFVGRYTDFNWEGDGIFDQWHYQLEQGHLAHHIGTATGSPYRVRWDTRWLPDQGQPIEIAAWVTNTHGITYVTPAVQVTLSRHGRSVRMYTAHDIPEYFAVRAGKRMSCKITIPDDPAKATSARLILSTWSAGHADALGLNDQKVVTRIGRNDYYSYDSIVVDKSILKQGENSFYIFSDSVHHAAEINWPGPVLVLETLR